ncbi:IS66 family transposase [Mahella australiensis]|uniref:Transposase n=1 Tax=Mahella australiensis (strain DSM 15567 / CIP 107919 / 50-1 BON) TaxID=697281 RepID=F3ZXH9_MAHA5|nr:transposase [Mahella australiensis]AEE97660.1 transposase [Mahella australiensis 50-1 BON]
MDESESKIIRTYDEDIDAVIVMVKDMSLHIDLLNGTIICLNNKIVDLEAFNARQEIQIAELEARLNKNSDNSSKPPSSDGYKKAVYNTRQKSGKLSGGQPGHEGETLEKVQNPDEIIEYKVADTCDYGCSLTDIGAVKRTRQVFDISEPQIKVTEYVTYEKVCPICGKVYKREFPAEVTQPAQYGQNMCALMNYLTYYQLLPLERAAETDRDVTGQKVSEGTLVNAATALYEGLEGPVEEIKQSIIDSEIAHLDETGIRSEGSTKWLHVACTDRAAYYAVHEKSPAVKCQGPIGNIRNMANTLVFRTDESWRNLKKF